MSMGIVIAAFQASHRYTGQSWLCAFSSALETLCAEDQLFKIQLHDLDYRPAQRA